MNFITELYFPHFGTVSYNLCIKAIDKLINCTIDRHLFNCSQKTVDNSKYKLSGSLRIQDCQKKISEFKVKSCLKFK